MATLVSPDVLVHGLPGLKMPQTCQDTNSWTCATVFHWTGNEDLAHASAWLIGKPLAIFWLLVLGFLARWLIHKVITRLVTQASNGVLSPKLARGPLVEVARANQERRTQRALTMGSLLRSIVTGVISVIVLIMAIAQLGYNIAPLIASAGIIGLALGFGAQSLVKDFLSGIFMIFEDQYGVGDVIDLGEVSGTVEAVTLRVTRLRSIDGTVWYVRNGEILRVGNQSQNWARTVLDVSVGYGEDLARVRRVLKEVAHDLCEDEEYGRLIIEEPEVWGVQSLDADGVVVRVTLKTLPMKQWNVAREMRERTKARFDREGIEMPLPQRVLWHRDQDPDEGPGQAIGEDHE